MLESRLGLKLGGQDFTYYFRLLESADTTEILLAEQPRSPIMRDDAKKTAETQSPKAYSEAKARAKIRASKTLKKEAIAAYFNRLAIRPQGVDSFNEYSPAGTLLGAPDGSIIGTLNLSEGQIALDLTEHEGNETVTRDPFSSATTNRQLLEERVVGIYNARVLPKPFFSFRRGTRYRGVPAAIMSITDSGAPLPSVVSRLKQAKAGYLPVGEYGAALRIINPQNKIGVELAKSAREYELTLSPPLPFAYPLTIDGKGQLSDSSREWLAYHNVVALSRLLYPNSKRKGQPTQILGGEYISIPGLLPMLHV
jgi:hypothetical protein